MSNTGCVKVSSQVEDKMLGYRRDREGKRRKDGGGGAEGTGGEERREEEKGEGNPQCFFTNRILITIDLRYRFCLLYVT